MGGQRLRGRTREQRVDDLHHRHGVEPRPRQRMSVQVLVEGQWMSGHVLAVDGHGVVLDSVDGEHAVIRMGSVSAVRVCAPPPFHVAIERAARPMPGPREPSG